MFKNLTAIIAGTLIALAAGPVFAKSNSVPAALDTLQDAVDALQNLLEPKTIFVSSTEQNGNLGGLAGADLICQSLADGLDSIVPEGEYVALLSIFNVENASARITPSSGPYIRPDGAPLAPNFAGLFGHSFTPDELILINFARIDESGALTFGSSGRTWTATTQSGTSAGNDCAGWTDGTTQFGNVGSQVHNNGRWLNNGIDQCDQDRAIYCVQR